MGGNSLGSSSGMTSGNSYNNLRTSGGKSDLDSVESGGVSLATIANLLLLIRVVYSRECDVENKGLNG